MRKNLKLKINEALSSVLPITLIVLLLSFTLTPMPTGTLMLFIFGRCAADHWNGLFLTRRGYRHDADGRWYGQKACRVTIGRRSP